MDTQAAEQNLTADIARQSSRLTPDRFMSLIGKHVRQWNAAFNIPGPQAELVETGVLQNSFPAFLLVSDDPARASRWVVHTWQDYAGEAERLPAPENGHSALEYDLAVFDFLAENGRTREGRHILTLLMSHLGISQDEAGRMFNVSGETIRRWERGQVRIPHERMAELVSTEAALHRLESLFLPERLPQVIRRRAELFGGDRALDLILRGRIAEVAERYESALSYQA